MTLTSSCLFDSHIFDTDSEIGKKKMHPTQFLKPLLLLKNLKFEFFFYEMKCFVQNATKISILHTKRTYNDLFAGNPGVTFSISEK